MTQPRRIPRRGENSSGFERTDRVQKVDDDGWYIQTREGIALGPYRTNFDARLAASLLISKLSQIDPIVQSRNAILEFSRDPSLGPAGADRLSLRQQGIERLREIQQDRDGVSFGAKMLARVRSILMAAKSRAA